MVSVRSYSHFVVRKKKIKGQITNLVVTSLNENIILDFLKSGGQCRSLLHVKHTPEETASSKHENVTEDQSQRSSVICHHCSHTPTDGDKTDRETNSYSLIKGLEEVPQLGKIDSDGLNVIFQKQ